VERAPYDFTAEAERLHTELAAELAKPTHREGSFMLLQCDQGSITTKTPRASRSNRDSVPRPIKLRSRWPLMSDGVRTNRTNDRKLQIMRKQLADCQAARRAAAKQQPNKYGRRA
jgi:hypothetical protein